MTADRARYLELFELAKFAAVVVADAEGDRRAACPAIFSAVDAAEHAYLDADAGECCRRSVVADHALKLRSIVEDGSMGGQMRRVAGAVLALIEHVAAGVAAPVVDLRVPAAA